MDKMLRFTRENMRGEARMKPPSGWRRRRESGGENPLRDGGRSCCVVFRENISILFSRERFCVLREIIRSLFLSFF